MNSTIAMKNQKTPGERLFLYLLNRYSHQKSGSDSWIHTMSIEFEMPDLEDYLLRSTVLMVHRRLMANASWYLSRKVEEASAFQSFERDFLGDMSDFSRNDQRFLANLTFDAVKESKKDIPSGLYKRLRSEAKGRNARCKIGGCAIDYDADAASHCSFSLDHMWPQSLGGSSEEWNLQVACSDCNSIRKDLVEASDAHYEHFHVKLERPANGQATSFLSELHKVFRIAALIRADFRCEMCGLPVDSTESDMDFVLPNRNETYNIFNIMVACAHHRH